MRINAFLDALFFCYMKSSMSFLNDFSRDYRRMTGNDITFFASLVNIVLRRHIRYMFYIRLLQDKSFYIFYPLIAVLRIFLSRKTGIEILPQTRIGAGFRMVHPYNITINENAIIGENVNMYKGSTIGISAGKHHGCPTIGNKVQIGINSTVIGKIQIGNDVLVAPNTLVNFDVPDHSIVIGNPAKVIHKENATRDYVYFC